MVGHAAAVPAYVLCAVFAAAGCEPRCAQAAPELPAVQCRGLSDAGTEGDICHSVELYSTVQYCVLLYEMTFLPSEGV